MTPDTSELVDLYKAEDPGLDHHVIAAFIEADREPPSSEQIARNGFSAVDFRDVLTPYYKRHDPYRERATFNEAQEALDA